MWSGLFGEVFLSRDRVVDVSASRGMAGQKKTPRRIGRGVTLVFLPETGFAAKRVKQRGGVWLPSLSRS